jgi:hypothetical protein
MEKNQKSYFEPKIDLIFYHEDVLCASKDDGTSDIYSDGWVDTNFKNS